MVQDRALSRNDIVMTDKVIREHTRRMSEFALRRFKENASLNQIAAETGRSVRMIRRYLKLAGVSLAMGRKPKVLDSSLEGLYEKLALKQTSYDILASEFKVSVNTIRLRIAQYERNKRLNESTPTRTKARGG
jgi:hypothetical protein